MKTPRRPLVALYAALSVVAIGALGAATALVLRQQAEHARAVADALHQEDVRTALWRMETRVSTLLAMTTSRASVAPPQAGSYAANWIAGDNSINPTNKPPEELASELVEAADQAFIVACSVGALNAKFDASPPPAPQQEQMLSNRGVERSAGEYERRQWTQQLSQVASNVDPSDASAEVLVGPLATRWDRSGEQLGLQFARRIEGPGGASHESYRIEWTELERLLVAEVTDLFPQARLEPLELASAKSAPDALALRLAAVPAALVVPPPRPAENLPRGHLWALAGAWTALAVALAVGGLALRSSYAYGDKHRRFTHAVTHELRTPLTTFRLYSEMLARGMVPAAKQPEYLATLETESSRLARLVDNVLRYARLEDGRNAAPHAPTTAARLVERCVPELARTCAAHGARLEVEDLLERDAPLATDSDAVLQILSNLVENACKYGRDDAASPIRLRAAVHGEQLWIDVSDQGAGVPSEVSRTIFEPFDRGGRDSSDRAPGVGLGLALARGLASELGGELTLEPAPRGATFRLALPLA